MIFFLLFPLFLQAKTSDTGTDPRRLTLEMNSTIYNGLALTTLANNHTDHLRFLEARDLDPREQKEYYSIWQSEMGFFVYKFPLSNGVSQHLNSGSFLAGLDRRTPSINIIGGGLGYLYSYYNQTFNGDEGHINCGYGTIYGNITLDSFYLEPALWGIYQNAKNSRNIITDALLATGVASIQTWQLEPHLELGFNFPRSWGRYNPYASFDYLMSWKARYQEVSANIYNATVGNLFFSTLKTEIGVKLHNIWTYTWGYIFSKEKLALTLESFFVPSFRIDQLEASQSFLIPSNYSTKAIATIGMDIGVTINKAAPLGIRIAYQGNFTNDGLSNKIQFLISKIF